MLCARRQGFHPSNPKNLKKLFEAEQKKDKEEKMKEELTRQHKDEMDRRENRGLIAKSLGKETGPERTAEMAFMEQAPPGLAEALERQKGEKAASTRAERDAERFAILKNAPRAGDFTNDLQVTHKPFGVALKNAKCTRCQQWGHSLGDRECPMRDVNPQDAARKAQMDPLARLSGLESSGAPLRWELKGGAPGEGVHGRASSSDANQQFVVDAQDERAQASNAALADIDPALLAALSEKQQKKLLKMYTKELRSAARDEADEGRGEKKRKHKKEKKEKKEKHKKKKRKKDDSGSSSGGSDSD